MDSLGMEHQSAHLDVSSHSGFSWGDVAKRIFMPDRAIESTKIHPSSAWWTSEFTGVPHRSRGDLGRFITGRFTPSMARTQDSYGQLL